MGNENSRKKSKSNSTSTYENRESSSRVSSEQRLKSPKQLRKNVPTVEEVVTTSTNELVSTTLDSMHEHPVRQNTPASCENLEVHLAQSSMTTTQALTSVTDYQNNDVFVESSREIHIGAINNSGFTSTESSVECGQVDKEISPQIKATCRENSCSNENADLDFVADELNIDREVTNLLQDLLALLEAKMSTGVTSSLQDSEKLAEQSSRKAENITDNSDTVRSGLETNEIQLNQSSQQHRSSKFCEGNLHEKETQNTGTVSNLCSAITELRDKNNSVDSGSDFRCQLQLQSEQSVEVDKMKQEDKESSTEEVISIVAAVLHAIIESISSSDRQFTQNTESNEEGLSFEKETTEKPQLKSIEATNEVPAVAFDGVSKQPIICSDLLTPKTDKTFNLSVENDPVTSPCGEVDVNATDGVNFSTLFLSTDTTADIPDESITRELQSVTDQELVLDSKPGNDQQLDNTNTESESDKNPISSAEVMSTKCDANSNNAQTNDEILSKMEANVLGIDTEATHDMALKVDELVADVHLGSPFDTKNKDYETVPNDDEPNNSSTPFEETDQTVDALDSDLFQSNEDSEETKSTETLSQACETLESTAVSNHDLTHGVIPGLPCSSEENGVSGQAEVHLISQTDELQPEHEIRTVDEFKSESEGIDPSFPSDASSKGKENKPFKNLNQIENNSQPNVILVNEPKTAADSDPYQSGQDANKDDADSQKLDATINEECKPCDDGDTEQVKTSDGTGNAIATELQLESYAASIVTEVFRVSTDLYSAQILHDKDNTPQADLKSLDGVAEEKTSRSFLAIDTASTKTDSNDHAKQEVDESFKADVADDLPKDLQIENDNSIIVKENLDHSSDNVLTQVYTHVSDKSERAETLPTSLSVNDLAVEVMETVKDVESDGTNVQLDQEVDKSDQRSESPAMSDPDVDYNFTVNGELGKSNMDPVDHQTSEVDTDLDSGQMLMDCKSLAEPQSGNASDTADDNKLRDASETNSFSEQDGHQPAVIPTTQKVAEESITESNASEKSDSKSDTELETGNIQLHEGKDVLRESGDCEGGSVISAQLDEITNAKDGEKTSGKSGNGDFTNHEPSRNESDVQAMPDDGSDQEIETSDTELLDAKGIEPVKAEKTASPCDKVLAEEGSDIAADVLPNESIFVNNHIAEVTNIQSDVAINENHSKPYALESDNLIDVTQTSDIKLVADVSENNTVQAASLSPNLNDPNDNQNGALFTTTDVESTNDFTELPKATPTENVEQSHDLNSGATVTTDSSSDRCFTIRSSSVVALSTENLSVSDEMSPVPDTVFDFTYPKPDSTEKPTEDTVSQSDAISAATTETDGANSNLTLSPNPVSPGPSDFESNREARLFDKGARLLKKKEEDRRKGLAAFHLTEVINGCKLYNILLKGYD